MLLSRYIGVSGFMARGDVDAVLQFFPDCGRQLMVGVLVSQKTLAGHKNKYPLRYPDVDRIAGIFSDDPRCLNLIHYASDTPADDDTLHRLYDWGGPHCHGFQFNLARPHPHALYRMVRRFGVDRRPPPRIVMQSLPRVHGLQDKEVCTYGALVTDILIDASGGRGELISVEAAAQAATYLTERHRMLRRTAPLLGIAGGLGPGTVDGVSSLLADGFNCDAEGRLRDDTDGGGNLNIDRVRDYVLQAAAAVRRGK